MVQTTSSFELSGQHWSQCAQEDLALFCRYWETNARFSANSHPHHTRLMYGIRAWQLSENNVRWNRGFHPCCSRTVGWPWSYILDESIWRNRGDKSLCQLLRTVYAWAISAVIALVCVYKMSFWSPISIRKLIPLFVQQQGPGCKTFGKRHGNNWTHSCAQKCSHRMQATSKDLTGNLLGPVHTGRGAPCDTHMQIMRHTAVNGSIHTGLQTTSKGLQQICLRVLCEWAFGLLVFCVNSSSWIRKDRWTF